MNVLLVFHELFSNHLKIAYNGADFQWLGGLTPSQ